MNYCLRKRFYTFSENTIANFGLRYVYYRFSLSFLIDSYHNDSNKLDWLFLVDPNRSILNSI